MSFRTKPELPLGKEQPMVMSECMQGDYCCKLECDNIFEEMVPCEIRQNWSSFRIFDSDFIKKICTQNAQEDHILTGELIEIKDEIRKMPYLKTSKNLTKSENLDQIAENINQLSTSYLKKSQQKKLIQKLPILQNDANN
ncbi:unnamed protein product [Moneuplotes crassus]|uniref:Uncharacterized protein n=1 Tax=Euplotes crassus TaxID=5936 RepID=A0AAD1XN21_EUPCR|nr:unnamed protein product [Moneuplotes crassus]